MEKKYGIARFNKILLVPMWNQANRCLSCGNRSKLTWIAKIGVKTHGTISFCPKCGEFTMNVDKIIISQGEPELTQWMVGLTS